MISTNTIIKIQSIKGMNNKMVRLIIDSLPSMILSDHQLSKILIQLNPNLNPDTITEGLQRGNMIISKSQHLGISYIQINSPAYPSPLKQIQNPPLILSYKGNIKLLQTACIAIVGAREGTTNGLTKSFMYGKLLAEKGFTIVSGLAKGCDRFAHEGCLEAKGNTIAVLANPLNYIYPNENKRLADQILESGGLLLSESFIGERLNAGSFLKRNRIQVGLCKAIIVIESNGKGGTMKTIEFSIKNKRKVGMLTDQNISPRIPFLFKSAKVQSLANKNEVLCFAADSNA